MADFQISQKGAHDDLAKLTDHLLHLYRESNPGRTEQLQRVAETYHMIIDHLYTEVPYVYGKTNNPA